MEHARTVPDDFPTDGVELSYFLVVSDYARALAFYRDVLGATVVRELPGTLCFLNFRGSQILLSAPGGLTKDKPTDMNSAIGELTIRVPDCSAARRGCCAPAEPSSSRRLSSGATRSGPSSTTLMVISWRSLRTASRRNRGSYAEYTCVPLQNVFPLQTTLEWATLAAKPEYYATAWSCLFANLRIRASEVLFVRGGTSALGQAAITIAKRERVTVFPFEHIPDAHRLMEANGANGKIVVVR